MTTSSGSPQPLIARSPEDLLAMVPYVLGFRPGNSLVLLTFGGEQNFHARTDLPDDGGGLAETVELLVEPARRHRVGQAVVVGYADDDPQLCREALSLLAAELTWAGVQVVAAMRVCRGRWFTVPEGDPEGVPFDERAHPIAARAVFEGRVTHESREALARSLVGVDPAATSAVGQEVLAAARRRGNSSRAAETAWAIRVVARRVASGEPFDDAEAGRLLVAGQESGVREKLVAHMRRDHALGHVEVWRDLLRRTPEELCLVPASMLGFAAWLSGDGALAWCALDRLRNDEADAPIGDLVADAVSRMLETAVPPSTWRGGADGLGEVG